MIRYSSHVADWDTFEKTFSIFYTEELADDAGNIIVGLLHLFKLSEVNNFKSMNLIILVIVNIISL